jgi:hypothetical protein
VSRSFLVREPHIVIDRQLKEILENPGKERRRAQCWHLVALGGQEFRRKRLILTRDPYYERFFHKRRIISLRIHPRSRR